ncbi:YtxH domain-containing protein [Aerococcus suis]|uniref:Gas vesicle protein n=1 Tax=Aerococcus suis TaxID=371602 RepID=A0A1W1YJH1_9LACT|nr:YtxH domain-containing protein [Aerococcus suis]MCI7240535.1 YtxH domain-containing protein [Aerococcus suis]MDY4646054.1 YtxH domain-containing protein [Aerococcus suis]SMC35931.1 Gas vesicle protein [Aerococcus suis]
MARLSKFITGLISGAVVAGGYTLLNNPNTGKENREKVKNYADGVSHAATDMQGSIARAQTSVSDLVKQGQSSSQIIRNDIGQAIQDFKNSAVPQYNEMQKKINQLNNDVATAQITFKKNS